MLQFINKHINHIFYGFLILHIILVVKIVLLNPGFDSYMHLENEYGDILAISNTLFIILLFFKQLLTEIYSSNQTFLKFIQRNHKLIIGNIVVFFLLTTNGALEGKFLLILQHAHTNIIPLHFILYIFTIYMGYSQYKEIFDKYNSLQSKNYKQSYAELLAVTKSGIKELIFVATVIALSGKFNLATYIIHHINVAILFILGTSTIVFIALLFIHSVKRYKQ